MKSARGKLILASVFIAQVFISCSSSPAGNSNPAQTNANQSAQRSAAASDKAEELALLINLPLEPEETVWREDPAGQGGEQQYSKKLTAVMQFAAADAEKLSALVEKGSPPLTANIGTEPWFPAELIAQSDLSGDDTLKGDSFPATDFFQPPYSEGRITRVEGTNYFILELFAK